MSNEQIDRTVGTHGPKSPAVAEPEPGSPDIPTPATDLPKRLPGVIRPVSAVVMPVSGVMKVARASVSVVRRGAGSVVARLPGTVQATRAGAHDATSALQTLPDPTLRTLAASSVGLGAGFYLAGAPRLILVAGVIPAVIMGTAIALRPIEVLVANEADR